MLQAKQLLQGRYCLQHSLGQNAGRQTWRAEDQKETPPHPVIVKLLAFSPQMQWDEFKLFEREAQVLKTLNHPRIPKYRDYFSLDQHLGEGLCWFALVQDSIPGYSLEQRLDESQRFSEEQVKSIATQVLEILIYLHGLNPPVLHRDIKPSNLIWGEDEQVYLVDFGAVQDPMALEGTTFTVVGTAGYAPLEQFYGKAVEASDLYALGATLIHLLTGISPADLPHRNLRLQFRDQVSLNSGFLQWIESMTEPDLERRFVSATQALDTLKTGRSLPLPEATRRKPAMRRIQAQAAQNQLVIKVRVGQLSVHNLIRFGGKLLLTLTSLLLLISPIAIGILAGFLVILAILSGNLKLSALLLVIPLIILLLWSAKKTVKELKIVRDDINQARLACFGIQSLYLYKKGNHIVFDQSFDNIGFNKFLLSFNNERYSSCRISDIQSIEAIPFEGIVIQSGNQRYVLGQELGETECEWLAQKIKNWLSAG
ncbi:serine/threonine protein kinase [Microcoleus sp. ZQ-A2]|nr:serine/threonine protein kinase [Microcoleus sp. FACHB-1]